MKINKYLLIILIGIYLIPNIVYASSTKSGDIKNPIVTVTKDDVTVTKEVSKTDTDMVYNIEFTIKGKDVTVPTTKELYISVLFDKSGSMLCERGTDTFSINIFDKSTTINNQTLYCDAFDTVNENKWNNAVNGAIKFSTDILENISSSKINLYTFSNTVSEKTDWTTSFFTSELFDYPNGSTNLHLAVDAATTKLMDTGEDSLKYIVIISDGEPSDSEKLETSITNAKSSGIKIYTIGYDVSDDAKNTLLDISSGEDYYFDSSVDGIGTVLKDVSTGIKDYVSGTDGILKDTIGESFTFDSGSVTNTDNVVSYEINEITSEETTFNFKIKLSDNIQTGWHKTNNVINEGVTFTYKDSNNQEQKIIFEESSEIYFEKEKYPYTINYYKDTVSVDNLLGKIEGVMEIDSILKKSSIDKDKYLPKGYSSNDIILNDLVIGDEDNTINIVYIKQKYPYYVEYYKDEVSLINLVAKTKDFYEDYNLKITNEVIEDDLGKDFLNLYKPDGYKTGILLDVDTTIDIENNVIKVLYSKEDNLMYRVEYYFNGKIDDTKTQIINNQSINATIDNLEFSTFPDYELKETTNYPLVISSESSKNIIKVYYTTKNDIVLPPKTFVSSTNNTSINIVILSTIISTVLFLINGKYNFVKHLKK